MFLCQGPEGTVGLPQEVRHQHHRHLGEHQRHHPEDSDQVRQGQVKVIVITNLYFHSQQMCIVHLRNVEQK